MDYKEMDQEFVALVEMAFESDLRVEIIFEAIKTAQEHPYSSSPKLALQVALSEWDK